MDQKKIIISVVLALAAVAAFILIGMWQMAPNQSLAQKTTVQQMAQVPSTNPQGAGPLAGGPETAPGTGTAPLPGAGPETQPQAPIVNNNQEVVVVYGGDNTAYTSANGKAIAIGPGASSATRQNPDGSVESTAQTEARPSAVKPAAELGQAVAPSTSTTAPVAGSAKTDAKAPKAAKEAAPKETAPAKPALAPAKAAPAAAPAGQVRVREFWIQVISTPNRDRVELLKKDLGSRGWSGRISATEVSGTTYYRLRYGPFDQTAEASRFLAYVKAVPGLETAFVVEEYPLKTVAR